MHPRTSPKTIARQAANSLHQGEELSIEQIGTIKFDPERHLPYRRVIELKETRFAITAELIDQVADKLLIGEGHETRMPALQVMRNVPSSFFTDSHSLEKMLDDWSDMDCSAEVMETLLDDENTRAIEAYQLLVEDIVSDTTAENQYLHFDNAFDELEVRTNPTRSLEMQQGVFMIMHLILQSPIPQQLHTPEDRRRLIIDSIPFLQEMSDLETTHAGRYFDYKWNRYAITPEEAGVELRRDALDNLRLRLTEREKRPELTFGPPIGCPANFNLESKEQKTISFTALERYAIAYINETYDRGLL